MMPDDDDDDDACSRLHLSIVSVLEIRTVSLHCSFVDIADTVEHAESLCSRSQGGGGAGGPRRKYSQPRPQKFDRNKFLQVGRWF